MIWGHYLLWSWSLRLIVYISGESPYFGVGAYDWSPVSVESPQLNNFKAWTRSFRIARGNTMLTPNCPQRHPDRTRGIIVCPQFNFYDIPLRCTLSYSNSASAFRAGIHVHQKYFFHFSAVFEIVEQIRPAMLIWWEHELNYFSSCAYGSLVTQVLRKINLKNRLIE